MNRIIIVDATTLAALVSVHQTVEVCDHSGRILGHFIPLADSATHAGREPRISEGEIERRLHRGGGRELAEILHDLEMGR